MINIARIQAFLYRAPPQHAPGLPLLPTELMIIRVREDHLDARSAAVRQVQDIFRCDVGTVAAAYANCVHQPGLVTEGRTKPVNRRYHVRGEDSRASAAEGPGRDCVGTDHR